VSFERDGEGEWNSRNVRVAFAMLPKSHRAMSRGLIVPRTSRTAPSARSAYPVAQLASECDWPVSIHSARVCVPWGLTELRDGAVRPAAVVGNVVPALRVARTARFPDHFEMLPFDAVE
jgi:hypothetical protein